MISLTAHTGPSSCFLSAESYRPCQPGRRSPVSCSSVGVRHAQFVLALRGQAAGGLLDSEQPKKIENCSHAPRPSPVKAPRRTYKAAAAARGCSDSRNLAASRLPRASDWVVRARLLSASLASACFYSSCLWPRTLGFGMVLSSERILEAGDI